MKLFPIKVITKYVVELLNINFYFTFICYKNVDITYLICINDPELLYFAYEFYFLQ